MQEKKIRMVIDKKSLLLADENLDITKEIMYDSVEWQIADQPVNGDEYNELHSYVMSKAIEILYKQNTTPVG